MTTAELLNLHQEICEAARDLMRKKNHDYAGKDGKTPFANFEVGEALGIGSTIQGILFRMSDKFKRLIEYNKSLEFSVTDESFQDTIMDMINYSIILAGYNNDMTKGSCRIIDSL